LFLNTSIYIINEFSSEIERTETTFKTGKKLPGIVQVAQSERRKIRKNGEGN
jgi:hypothetical protein